MIAELNRPSNIFTNPWTRVRSNTQPKQVRVSQTVVQTHDTDMLMNIGQGDLLQPESPHLQCLAAMSSVRRAIKVGRRRLLSDAWQIRQSGQTCRQWSPNFKRPKRFTEQTKAKSSRKIFLVGIFDKRNQCFGSQINDAGRTERPDLLRTGDDAAVAAKTAGNNSPVQPHSGTLGHTSFTCKEGGERDDREADGNEIKEISPSDNNRKDPKIVNNNSLQPSDQEALPHNVNQEQERRVRTRGALKTPLRVSARVAGSPASALEPDTPQLQPAQRDRKFIVENVSSKTNSNEDHKNEGKIALRRSTRNQMREQSNKAFLQLPQGARSVREDSSELLRTRRPSHSNGGKSTTSNLHGTSTSNDDRRSQRLHARRQQTDAAAKKKNSQSNKGKYNEKYHDGLYRFQDHLAPSQATFGLSFARNPIVAEPMIFVPTSPREAKALCKAGAYRKFRTFEAGQQQGDKMSKQEASQIDEQDEESSDESLDTPSMHKIRSSVYPTFTDVPQMRRQTSYRDPQQSQQQQIHTSMHDTNQIRIVQQEKRSASSTGLAANQIEKNSKNVLNNQMKATAEGDQERPGDLQGSIQRPGSAEGGGDGKTQDCVTQGSAKDSRGQDIARVKADSNFIRPSPLRETQMVSSHAGRHNTPNDQIMQSDFKEPGSSGNQMGRWTVDEHEKFLAALQIYGKDWQRVQAHIGTRSSAQIRSHAQKFFNQIKKKGHQVLIKDTKYKQTRSKRRRTSPQQDSNQMPFMQEPLPNEPVFVVEKLEQSNERRLARQTIIYDDWLKPKPGYTQLCEEYEREQMELRELGQQSAQNSYYCEEEEGEDEDASKWPATQSERRTIEQPQSATLREASPALPSQTEPLEAQAQSSSHHVTIEEQQQRSPRSLQSLPQPAAQMTEKQEQRAPQLQHALLQLAAQPQRDSQQQQPESSRRQPVRFENLSERRKAKVKSKLSNCLPFNPRSRQSRKRQQKRILKVARPALSQLERLQFNLFTLQHSKCVMLQRRWWLNDTELDRIASFKKLQEAQEYAMNDFDRQAIDFAGTRFLRHLRQIQSEIYLMQQQVGQPLQSPAINGQFSMPSGNIDSFLKLFNQLIQLDLEEDASATRLFAQQGAAQTSTGSILGQIRLANQVAQETDENFMFIQQQAVNAQLYLIGAFREKLSDLSLKVQDMSTQIQKIKEEIEQNQPLMRELDQQICILLLELLLYGEFLNRLQASKEQQREQVQQLALASMMQSQGASLPPTALLTRQQRLLLMHQQLQNSTGRDPDGEMDAGNQLDVRMNGNEEAMNENDQQIVTETSHPRNTMWAQHAFGADSWDMPDYMHPIMDKLGSAPGLLQMQQLMNLRTSQQIQQNQKCETDEAQGQQQQSNQDNAVSITQQTKQQ